MTNGIGEGKATSAGLDAGGTTLNGDNHAAASGKTISSFLNELLVNALLVVIIYSDAGACCMFRSMKTEGSRHFG
jgi:hypothetical protein